MMNYFQRTPNPGNKMDIEEPPAENWNTKPWIEK